MGIFDKIIGNDKGVEVSEDTYYSLGIDEAYKDANSEGNKMILLEPRAYSESQQIADHLKKRNTVLASVGLIATEKLNKYRKRVAEKYGDDIEKEIYYGIKELTVEEEDEKGKKKSKKIKAMDNELIEHDIHCRFFDETSGLWDEYNGLTMHKILVMNAQKYCNQLIKSRVVYDKNDKVYKPGYLYLNEAYDALGMAKSDAGHHIGWLYDPEEDGPIDENHRYVDFGLFRNDQATRDFMNNKEKTVLLDFNVDGPISPYAYKTKEEINRIKNGGKNK